MRSKAIRSAPTKPDNGLGASASRFFDPQGQSRPADQTALSPESMYNRRHRWRGGALAHAPWQCSIRHPAESARHRRGANRNARQPFRVHSPGFERTTGLPCCRESRTRFQESVGAPATTETARDAGLDFPVLRRTGSAICLRYQLQASLGFHPQVGHNIKCNSALRELAHAFLIFSLYRHCSIQGAARQVADGKTAFPR